MENDPDQILDEDDAAIGDETGDVDVDIDDVDDDGDEDEPPTGVDPTGTIMDDEGAPAPAQA
jgi:hypothetical protein